MLIEQHQHQSPAGGSRTRVTAASGQIVGLRGLDLPEDSERVPHSGASGGNASFIDGNRV